MLQVGLGHAEGIDTRIVVEKAIDDCIKQLDTIKPQAGIVFAGPHFDHSLMLEIINDAFPGIGLVGCSTSATTSSLLITPLIIISTLLGQRFTMWVI